MIDENNPRAQRLRDAGYKLTQPRMAVLKALETSGGHVTSNDVLEAVSAIDASVGRASVFRSLDLFTQLGIIRPTYIGSSTTPTYVMLPDGHHHHIICVNCNRVIEFDECHLEDLEKTLEERLNVRLMGHLLEFYGECETCMTGESA